MPTTDDFSMEFDDRLNRAATGDRDSLGQIWRAYQPSLLRYFKVRLPDAAEDLASAVWIDVARNLSSFDGDEAGFRGWLFTIAHRRLVDELRRRTRHPELDADPADVDRPTIHDIAEDAFSLETALALVRRLPPDQAEAITLRIVADLDVTTVAAIMQRTEVNVRVLVHRGLEKLNVLCQNSVTGVRARAMNDVS